jgi:hypothetical protein
VALAFCEIDQPPSGGFFTSIADAAQIDIDVEMFHWGIDTGRLAE